MNTVNKICPQCGTALAPNESFCSNCGRRYTEGNIAEPTMPASSSNRYQSASSSNTTPPPPPSYGSSPYSSVPSGRSGQNYTPPPPPNAGYTPPPPAPRSDPRAYGQQPPMQAGSFAPPPQPQPRKGPRTGLIIGIISLLVILIVVGTGIYLFTKNRGGSTSTGPTAIHLQIKPYTYKGHTDQVLAAAWSPDGKRIASGGGAAFGGGDDSVQVWDALNGGHVFTYRGHTNGVNAISWSPDSRYVVSGSDDKTVQVWQPK